MTGPLDPSSNAIERDWLDDVLQRDAQEHREQYVADDGFSARVMHELPAAASSVAALPAWRKPVIAGMWAIATLGIVAVLPDAATDATQQILRAFNPQGLSLTEIGSVVLMLGAATWAGMGYALRKV